MSSKFINKINLKSKSNKKMSSKSKSNKKMKGGNCQSGLLQNIGYDDLASYSQTSDDIPLYSQTSGDWYNSNQPQPLAADLDVGINEYTFSRPTPNNKFVVATGLINTPKGLEMVGGGVKKTKKNLSKKSPSKKNPSKKSPTKKSPTKKSPKKKSSVKK